MHFGSTGINGFLVAHIKAHSTDQFGCTANWSFSNVYNGLGYCIDCCIRLRFEHSLPWPIDT